MPDPSAPAPRPIAGTRRVLAARVRDWLSRWNAVLPLFAAELIVWLGFGALLPIMPLYFREHGVDLRMLGFVIAAWPAARLIGEPVFGWVADRTARVPLMVAGLVVTAFALGLPLVITGPVPFLVLRALAGLSTAVYDPAARGYLTDSTPAARRGEAFGLYAAAQMAGLLLGPAIGGLGAALFGGVAFVFVFGAATTLLAALAVALRVHESPAVPRHHVAPSTDLTEFPSDPPSLQERAAADLAAEELAAADPPPADQPGSPSARPTTLRNRWLVSALVLNLGGFLSGGTYEVIWSVFLESRGAGLDLIGLTFAMFALPVLILSPIAGRLVDRRGVYPFIVAGSLLPAVASVTYPFIQVPVFVIPVVMLEASGFALLNPALYSVVAAGSPRGRSSTAQGLFGASGTVGTIIAAVATGYLAQIDIRYPFFIAATALLVCLVIGLAIGGGALRRLGPAAPSPARAGV